MSETLDRSKKQSLQKRYFGSGTAVERTAAGSMVAFAAPAGIQMPGVLITTKTLTDVAFLGSATVTATNMVVKVNDSAAYVTGYNAIGSTFGQKPYEFVRDTSKIGSDIVFAFGLQNIMVYGTNRNGQEEVQSERNNTNKYCLSGEEHYETYKEMFGAENVEWTSRDTLT